MFPLRLKQQALLHLGLESLLKGCLIFMLWGEAWADGWKAGFSRSIITPEKPIWMSGYASRDHVAEGTRTELWAKAMALEDTQGQRSLLITMDLVGVSRDVTLPIRKSLAKQHGLQLADIFINCSHTHTGPVVGENLRTMYVLDEAQSHAITEYTQHLVDQVISLGAEALQGLQPASLQSGHAQATFGTNRRQNPESLVPAWRASGRLRGPVDHAVPVLAIRDQDQKLIAVVFGYACHATVLNDYQWSGDYPGYAQMALESQLEGVQAMFWAGAGADINPLPRRSARLAQRYGEELGLAVASTLRGVMDEVSPKLITQYLEIDLSFDSLPTRSQLETESRSEDPYASARAHKWLEVIDAGGSLPKTYPYPIGLWRLGDTVHWLTLGGEVVIDYPLKFKETFGPSLWVAGYSHDVMGYIPSRRVWEEGGYEGGGSMIYYGQPARWSSQVEDHIEEAVAALMQGLEPSAP